MPRAPITDPLGEEVLFLTSSDRIMRAYLKWYEKGRPGNPQNLQDAVEQTRGMLRYLVVPTAAEYALYKEALSDR